jgi:hypothetical protein
MSAAPCALEQFDAFDPLRTRDARPFEGRWRHFWAHYEPRLVGPGATPYGGPDIHSLNRRDTPAGRGTGRALIIPDAFAFPRFRPKANASRIYWLFNWLSLRVVEEQFVPIFIGCHNFVQTPLAFFAGELLELATK